MADSGVSRAVGGSGITSRSICALDLGDLGVGQERVVGREASRISGEFDRRSRKVSEPDEPLRRPRCWSCARRLRQARRRPCWLRCASFLQVVDQLPELLGRERSGSAPRGRLADAVVGRNDRQRLGVRVLGDDLLDPGVGVLVAEREENARARDRLTRAGSRPGGTEASKTTVVSARPCGRARRQARRGNAGVRGETPRGPASARAGPLHASRCIHR